MRLAVSHRQAVAYRLASNNLDTRLPAASYETAARFGLQDSGPRDALVALHARVRGCEPSAWKDPRLIQTYSPRAAVYVLPAADFGIFTVGRLPLDPQARCEIEAMADNVCRLLNGRERRAGGLPGLRLACASGRVAIRWTTSALYVREVPRPDVYPEEARLELCRRHLRSCGPTTPATFGWWAGLSAADARATWRSLERELVPVDLGGQQAWMLATDIPALRSAPTPRGVRLLPSADLRLLGQDRSGLFVGPGAVRPPGYDTFHPHGLLVDGAVAGAWGRRGGRIEIVPTTSITDRTRTAVEAEGLAMPIPAATMRVIFTPRLSQ